MRNLRMLVAMAGVLAGSLAAQAEPPQMFVPEGMEGFTEDYKLAPAIRAGDYVFISGVTAYVDPEAEPTPEIIEEAIRGAFGRVGAVLASAGTGWGDVVEMTSFHVDMRSNQEIFRKVRAEHLPENHYPAWTAIGVDKLWVDSLIVEIRVVAYVGG